MKNRRRQQGFTVVELLIVLASIGLLLALVVTTYSDIQARDRNHKRQVAINLIQHHIETFFAEKNHYPSFADLSSAKWDKANLPNLDPAYLRDPLAKSGGFSLSQSTGLKVYQYDPKDNSGNSCESDDTTCASYILTATLENGAGTYSQQNLD